MVPDCRRIPVNEQRGVIGWLRVVIVVVLFLFVYAVSSLIIPGDGEGDHPRTDQTTQVR
jgi:hypothetical protein